MTDINSLPIERQVALVQQCPALFKQIQNPSPEVRLAYVLTDPVAALQDIADPTDLEQFAGIVRDPGAAFYIKNPGPLAQFLLATGRAWDRQAAPAQTQAPQGAGRQAPDAQPQGQGAGGGLAAWVISPQGLKTLTWLAAGLLLMLYFYL